MCFGEQVTKVRPQAEPLTKSTIFSRAGSRVEAWGSCWDLVLLGCCHISCWPVLRKTEDKQSHKKTLYLSGNWPHFACIAHLPRYEEGRTLRWAGEGQLLLGNHHHLGAGACLVHMGGSHGPGSTAGGYATRAGAGSEPCPTGVEGLRRYQETKKTMFEMVMRRGGGKPKNEEGKNKIQGDM